MEKSIEEIAVGLILEFGIDGPSHDECGMCLTCGAEWSFHKHEPDCLWLGLIKKVWVEVLFQMHQKTPGPACVPLIINWGLSGIWKEAGNIYRENIRDFDEYSDISQLLRAVFNETEA